MFNYIFATYVNEVTKFVTFSSIFHILCRKSLLCVTLMIVIILSGCRSLHHQWVACCSCFLVLNILMFAKLCWLITLNLYSAVRYTMRKILKLKAIPIKYKALNLMFVFYFEYYWYIMYNFCILSCILFLFQRNKNEICLLLNFWYLLYVCIYIYCILYSSYIWSF